LYYSKNSFLGKAIETEFKNRTGGESQQSAREARATPQKHWRFLQIAEKKTAKISESLIMAQIYHKVRTFFQENF